MSRLGKRFIAKKKYFDYKSEYISIMARLIIA